MLGPPSTDYSIEGGSWAHERREVHTLDYKPTGWATEHKEVGYKITGAAPPPSAISPKGWNPWIFLVKIIPLLVGRLNTGRFMTQWIWILLPTTSQKGGIPGQNFLAITFAWTTCA